MTMENLQSDILSGRELLSPTPEAMVILMHGVGSNGDDLIALAPHLADIIGGNVAYLSPNAPQKFDGAPFSGAYQWFPLGDYNPANGNFNDYLDLWTEGVRAAQSSLAEFISEQRQRFNLPAGKIILLGFSQGTMVSLYASQAQIPVQGERFAGIVGYSGALFGRQDFSGVDGKTLPPCLILHGQQDEVVPYAAAENAYDFLKSIGADVTFKSYSGLAHSINEQGIADAGKFIKERLAKAEIIG